jgi:hypothetical protein
VVGTSAGESKGLPRRGELCNLGLQVCEPGGWGGEQNARPLAQSVGEPAMGREVKDKAIRVWLRGRPWGHWVSG